MIHWKSHESSRAKERYDYIAQDRYGRWCRDAGLGHSLLRCDCSKTVWVHGYLIM